MNRYSLRRAIKYSNDSLWVKVLPLDSYELMRGLLKEVSDRYSFTDVLAKKKSYTSAQEKTIRKVDAPIAKSEGFPVHPVTLSIRLSPNRQWVVCPRA
jgi:hypothetical protein